MAFIDPLSDPNVFFDTPPVPEQKQPAKVPVYESPFSQSELMKSLPASPNENTDQKLFSSSPINQQSSSAMNESFSRSSSTPSLDFNFNSSPPSITAPIESKQRPPTQFSSALDKAIQTIPQTSFIPYVSAIPSAVTPKPVIQLTKAEKAQDTGGSTYISYLIHTEIPEFNIDIETRHRYSEFEAFQKYIIRAYPTCVIPPIPDKHTISDYATKQAKAKEDPNTIEKRKRMLQTFLNRVATHPLLSRDVVFHKFLEPGIAWHEALTNATIPTSTINRNKSALQKLTEVKSLRNPDPQFTAAEDYTTRFSIQTNQALIVQRHLVKLEQESAQTYSELGAIFNAWSLSEKEISQAVENTGQAFDSMATVTTQLAHAMEERMTEPLQEYMFYSKGIERLLSWRHDRHVEFEVVTETIHSKKSSLQKLEASELEAQRLAAALRAEGTLGYRQHLPPPSISGAMSGDPSGVDGNSILAQSEYHPPAITPRPQGILATLNSLIDNDPEMTRRSTISKTKDRLTTLAEQRVAALQDLQAANLEIQTDLDRFQNGKIADFRNFFLSYALAMREYHRRSIDAWEDAKLHIEKVNH